jgi:steroid 5-alpha reductase family enzyme
MFDLGSYLSGLAVVLVAGLLVWLLSLVKRDVSIVDSLWPLMFLLAGVAFYTTLPSVGPRAELVLVLVALWSVRLFSYITWRNWGEEEDRRYQVIRANNEPVFSLKSLYIVFGFQGAIAWIVSVPLLAAMNSPAPLTVLDYIGIGVWLVGMIFESAGDLQLARFKADPANRGKVLDRGLWRFGNACIWWGFGVIAVAAGGGWALVSPLLMTILLLKVSGVSLLEKDIGDRRPGYGDYITRTSAFIPWPPRKIERFEQRSSQHG